MSIWADEQGLCTRTAKQYWQRAVWKGLIQINGDTWKWIAKDISTNVIDAEESPRKMEQRFNVDKMSYELMPEEEPPESFMEYAHQKDKENRIRNELRAKLRRQM